MSATLQHDLSKLTPATIRTSLHSVLANTGAGLLIWLGITISLLKVRGADLEKLRPLQSLGIAIGLLLLLAAIPLVFTARARSDATARAWRSRCALSTAICWLFGAGLMLLLSRQGADAGWISVNSMLLSFAAVAFVMALASAPTDGPARPLLLPIGLAQALLTGASLLFALIAMNWPGSALATGPLPSLLLLIVVATLLQLLHWQQAAALWPLAANRWRWLALVLQGALPLLLAGAIYLLPSLSRAGWWLVAGSVLAGSLIAHWQCASTVSAGKAASPDRN